MAIQLIGALSNVAAEVEAATRAARVTLRAGDIGALGSYRKAMTSGTIGAGLTANSLVYGWRWAPSPNTALAVVKRIAISLGDVTGFTAGFIAINGFFARPYTTLDVTGGTAGTFTGNNGKMRTSHATSAGATCAISTTAAISGGSETLDTDPFATASLSVAATAGAPPIAQVTELFRAMPGDYPLVFANLEGFILKATVPATGTWQLGVDVSWDEYATFAG